MGGDRTGFPRCAVVRHQPSRPPAHKEMTRTNKWDLVVVGGGAGGLSAARAGARRGRHTVLVQDGRPGGDCTFTGCVPSKTLIEAAAARRPFKDAMWTVHAAVERIAAEENAPVLRAEGIEVIDGRARFVGPRTLDVDGVVLQAGRVVIATGSRPAVPAIAGLEGADYLTNENIFALDELPDSLAVIGAGAVGSELAQAFARFGSRVHLVEAEGRVLPASDPDASAVVAEALAADGVDLRLKTSVARIDSGKGSTVRLWLSDDSFFEADRVLVAVGRRPVTAGLEPQTGGIELDEDGFVRTDRYLRTTARGVYAVGDVTGRILLTHAADEMGRLAVRNAFAKIRQVPFDAKQIPSVVFTDPEVAQVGITEADAAGTDALVAFLPMAEVDRAVTAGRTEGFVKLIAGPRPVLRSVGGGSVQGATVVAPRAGEMIAGAALAMGTHMFTGRLAQTVHAYPTWSTAVRQAAAQFFFEINGRRARPARPPEHLPS
jgi:pyruvate/2-oxoglutarate dehydrogenase complex dihydrolipoamide dehydrogenase (E3) component